MTRDEAIRILKHGFFYVCGSDSTDAIDAIKFAIEEMKAMQNNCWVNAKERLPEKEGVYLCWTVFNGVEAHYQINLWKDGRWFWVHDVRYWMPLPKPPKEVEING